MILTAGYGRDAPQASALLEGLEANIVMADTANDSDAFRTAIAALNAEAVIPNNPYPSETERRVGAASRLMVDRGMLATPIQYSLCAQLFAVIILRMLL